MITSTAKPTTRASSAYFRDRGKLRQILVTTHHGLIELRLKGLRTKETVDIGWLYDHSVRARVLRERAERRAARRRK